MEIAVSYFNKAFFKLSLILLNIIENILSFKRLWSDYIIVLTPCWGGGINSVI